MININVDVSPGSSIEDVAKEATELANRIGIPVEFKFNDVTCYARPNGNPKKLSDGYYSSISEKENPHKFTSN